MADSTLIALRPGGGRFLTGQGRCLLAAGPDGFVTGPDDGFFVHETRLLSRLRWLVDGEVPRAAGLASVEENTWMGYYIRRPREAPPDFGRPRMEPNSQQSLELRLSRFVGPGLHEDVDLINHTRVEVSFVLTLEADADFADMAELRGERRQKGTLRSEWRRGEDGWELAFDYEAGHQREGVRREIRRGVTAAFSGCPEPSRADRGASFKISLEPGGRWHACLDVSARIDGLELGRCGRCLSRPRSRRPEDEARAEFLRGSARVTARGAESLTAAALEVLERGRKDLAGLRLHDLDARRGWTVAAGLPGYPGLFGRDVLISARQAALCGPEMMVGALTALAGLQGRANDAWRDEAPGKLPHEASRGPLAALELSPLGRYYGSVTASSYYAIVLSDLWRWTGDKELAGRFVVPALEALACLDRHADLDGDGFYEYQTRSEQGLTNQGWKDSGDAVVGADGAPVGPPIAICEEQGYVYLAKTRMSELLWWLGRKPEAKRLKREARELKARFNAVFWMEDEGTFALGLDSRKRLIRAATSNPGHSLACGIVDSARARRVADRLMEDDLFSGWGVRTLSSRNPGFNPFSYHRGSVWPVEQGALASAFARYGLHDHLQRLARGLFEAAALFEHRRLPELFGGHSSAELPFPGLYLDACSPQAWSASAPFAVVEALLGLAPYAAMDLLVVDPHLPEWLPELVLEDLRVAKSRLTIRFYRRRGGGSDYRVLSKHGTVKVVRQPSPSSLTSGVIERVTDLVSSLAPSR